MLSMGTRSRGTQEASADPMCYYDPDEEFFKEQNKKQVLNACSALKNIENINRL
ncbi:Uncharacterized protein dnm_031040 [Desulfonema magnum]|uniref:Uncharacterized protein n=1 Tax=Desulfonema magnum TaxID=45655 RepID=A0A975BKQ1_9BACT|nr:Uncharacterized protein dnm_031040 [Desulfonema magnum]